MRSGYYNILPPRCGSDLSELLVAYRKVQGSIINSSILQSVEYYHRKRINTEGKAKVVAAAWGTKLIRCLAALAILHQDDLKKRIRRITATWRNRCFEQMDDHLVHNTLNNTLSKWMFSQTFFSKSSLLLNGQCGIQVRPPIPAGPTFAFTLSFSFPICFFTTN